MTQRGPFGRRDRGGSGLPGIPGGDANGTGRGDDDPAIGEPLRRVLIEPPGYAITSFLTAIGLTIGVGLAPRGLLLFVAAILLSVIEWRRVRAANPWLRLETPDDFRTHEGKAFLRYSAWGTAVMVAMSLLALYLVQSDPGAPPAGAPVETVSIRGQEAAAIGPALVSGVTALLLNYLLKRAIARPPAPTDQVPRMGEKRD